jgi:hypothetical protein
MNKLSPLILVLITTAFILSGMAFTPAAGAELAEQTSTSPAPTWTPGPPAPTWTPGPPPLKTPIPSPARTDGAVIELNVRFPSSWPWAQIHWQELWTIVQWQDGFGDWHDVTGWQGTLDSISYQDGVYAGKKVWWAGRDQAVPGTFRWLVLQEEEGETLGTSQPFTARTYQLVSVAISMPHFR